MRIKWILGKKEVLELKKFVEAYKNHPFVKRRIVRNVNIKSVPDIDREKVWYLILTCLLSTHQRSGPGSPIYRFCSQKPFPLSYQKCFSQKEDLSSFVEYNLTNFGGIRRAPTIGLQAEKNFKWVKESWSATKDIADELLTIRKLLPNIEHVQIERKGAHFIQENFSGFGPKQSRNFWQGLGLTRFEIPLDSRITKWLNKNKFPVTLSANGLADINYYEFTMTGVQQICMQCNILPCVFDAAVFASFEKEWPEDEIVW